MNRQEYLSRYGLDKGIIWFDSRQGQIYFLFSKASRLDSGAHPASYSKGMSDVFPGDKSGRCLKLTIHIYKTDMPSRKGQEQLYFQVLTASGTSIYS